MQINSCESVQALSSEACGLLHEIRLRGFRPATGNPLEQHLTEAGFVAARGPNLTLTQAGREAHAAWGRLTPDSPEEVAEQDAYKRFLALNREFLRICTDWQLKSETQPNDHSDPAYDYKVLDRLDRLDDRIASLLENLSASVSRFGGYRQRLTQALDKIGEDRAWLASPRCDSYHTVWMQLHEDLLVAVGVNRADEAQPG